MVRTGKMSLKHSGWRHAILHCECSGPLCGRKVNRSHIQRSWGTAEFIVTQSSEPRARSSGRKRTSSYGEPLDVETKCAWLESQRCAAVCQPADRQFEAPPGLCLRRQRVQSWGPPEFSKCSLKPRHDIVCKAGLALGSQRRRKVRFPARRVC